MTRTWVGILAGDRSRYSAPYGINHIHMFYFKISNETWLSTRTHRPLVVHTTYPNRRILISHRTSGADVKFLCVWGIKVEKLMTLGIFHVEPHNSLRRSTKEYTPGCAAKSSQERRSIAPPKWLNPQYDIVARPPQNSRPAQATVSSYTCIALIGRGLGLNGVCFQKRRKPQGAACRDIFFSAGIFEAFGLLENLEAVRNLGNFFGRSAFRLEEPPHNVRGLL